MFVSELSLGPYGWVQILNFVLTGALILVFGVGLSAHFSTGAASRTGPALIQGIGVSLIASGPFTTDPSAMFGQSSIQGVVHGVFGAIVFTFAPISCFVFYRRFRHDPFWRPLSGWTLATGVVLTVGIVCAQANRHSALHGAFKAGLDRVHRLVEGTGHVDAETISKNEDPPERFRKLMFKLRGGFTVNAPGAFVSEKEPADVPDVVREPQHELVVRPDLSVQAPLKNFIERPHFKGTVTGVSEFGMFGGGHYVLLPVSNLWNATGARITHSVPRLFTSLN
jgi:hypothetical protein